jgi:hypothetical protein
MATGDQYPGQDAGLSSFSKRFVAITPDDDNDLPEVYKAIGCGESCGTIACVDAEGNEVSAYIQQGGVLQGIRPTRIKATGTTATPLFGIQ